MRAFRGLDMKCNFHVQMNDMTCYNDVRTNTDRTVKLVEQTV